MKDHLVLGICGVAGCGKDTFFKILQRYINIKRYSLADILKHECRDHCMKEYEIDPCCCSRAEKETIRNYLVEEGKKKRECTQGRYFVDKLNEEFLPLEGNVCVTDIRYDDYPEDEAHWIQKELNGYLVFVQKYKWDIREKEGFIIDCPANEEEERNIPKLHKRYDFIIDWEHMYEATELELHRAIEFHVQNFVRCLKARINEDKRIINLK